MTSRKRKEFIASLMIITIIALTRNIAGFFSYSFTYQVNTFLIYKYMITKISEEFSILHFLVW
jgi:hypothetical protein